MSTRHDIEKEQEALPRSQHTQDSVEDERVSPAQTFPQPPRPPRLQRNRWFVAGVVIVALVLILSLGVIMIPLLLQRPGGQVTPKTTPLATTVPTMPPGADVTPTPAPGTNLGPQAGPSPVKDPAYWDAIIGTQPGTSKVESVSIANIIGAPSLQALVTVRYTGAEARLDVYVFTNIISAKPTRLFKLAGLVKGDAKISGYNTVMTAEVDKNSTLNAGKAISAMTAEQCASFG